MASGGWPGPLIAAAGYLVADRDLIFAFVSCRRFFARLARTHDAALGIVFVRSLRHAVEIEIGADLGAGAAGPDNGRYDGVDLIAQSFLERRPPFVAADFADPIFAAAVGQEAAGFVDDRHPLRLEPVDGGGDQVADGPHLLRLQRAVDLEHDRRRRLDFVAREQRPLGQHQMHARGHDAVEATDGPGQLALERPQIVDILDEARGAEHVRFVENLVADAAAFGQAFAGQRHAQAGNAILRHHDDAAVVAQLVS